ncbi:AMP-binding protein [Pseudonocardia kujensis]|uniref:AMP-binding protein n=1 Tax=Pseudonocardia kujensis TaxID=1128675 RepID=UPI0022B7F254|nr:AMP-binding protein [Pseudonocardia kujensis]
MLSATVRPSGSLSTRVCCHSPATNPQIKGWILLSDRAPADTGIDTSLAPLHQYEELLDKQDAAMEWAEIDERSAYSACYTTGTTGRPKGVYYSHRAIYLHAMAEAAALNMGLADTTMLITPMFHAQCWGLPQAATLAGSKIVLPGRYRADDAGLLVEAFSKFHVSVANGAPIIFEPILDYIRKNNITLDLRGARLLSGSSEPPLELMRGLSEETGAEVIHAYGATETSPVVAVNRRKPHLSDTLGESELWELKRKQGLPVTGVDLVLLDENGQPQPHDGASVGEICLRGPWITARYHAMPDSEDRFTSDGYWRSGDVGTIDANGYLKLTDRIKDVIKSGGEWISSIDLENALLGHPAVREAAVVGVPHRRWQERAVGVVVLYEGVTVTEQELRGHLASRFAKWQVPERIFVASHIPRTSVGKIKKMELRERFWDTYMKE